MAEKQRTVEVELTDDDIRHAEEMLDEGDYDHKQGDDAGERGYR
jgi:hypothetical protein